MPETFTPHKEERMIIVKISCREAHLLKVLRKYSFGTIIVHKANGILIRVEPNESQLISEDEGMDLQLK